MNRAPARYQGDCHGKKEKKTAAHYPGHDPDDFAAADRRHHAVHDGPLSADGAGGAERRRPELQPGHPPERLRSRGLRLGEWPRDL